MMQVIAFETSTTTVLGDCFCHCSRIVQCRDHPYTFFDRFIEVVYRSEFCRPGRGR